MGARISEGEVRPADIADGFLAVPVGPGPDLCPVSLEAQHLQGLGVAAEGGIGAAAGGGGGVEGHVRVGASVRQDHGGLHHDLPDLRVGHAPLRDDGACFRDLQPLRPGFPDMEGPGEGIIRIGKAVEGNGVIPRRNGSFPAEGALPVNPGAAAVHIPEMLPAGINQAAFIPDLHGDGALDGHVALGEPVLAAVQIQGFGGGKGIDQGRGGAADFEAGGGGADLAVLPGELRHKMIGAGEEPFQMLPEPVPGDPVLPGNQGGADHPPGVLLRVVEMKDHLSGHGGLDPDFTGGIPLDGFGQGNREGLLRGGREGKRGNVQSEKKKQAQDFPEQTAHAHPPFAAAASAEYGKNEMNPLYTGRGGQASGRGNTGGTAFPAL